MEPSTNWFTSSVEVVVCYMCDNKTTTTIISTSQKIYISHTPNNNEIHTQIKWTKQQKTIETKGITENAGSIIFV